jgi:hypothetical protein
MSFTTCQRQWHRPPALPFPKERMRSSNGDGRLGDCRTIPAKMACHWGAGGGQHILAMRALRKQTAVSSSRSLYTRRYRARASNGFPASPVDTPWMWTLAFGITKTGEPTHGYEATKNICCIVSAPTRWGGGPGLDITLAVLSGLPPPRRPDHSRLLKPAARSQFP